MVVGDEARRLALQELPPDGVETILVSVPRRRKR
jgi:hypothetical protein